MESVIRYKAAVIGGTGGVGKQIINILNLDERCTEIKTIVRHTREEWKTEEFKEKLRVVETESLDNIQDHAEEFEGYDIFFCAIGTRVGVGKELFYKVDHDYPVSFANVAVTNKAHAYYLVSAMGAKASSWTYYSKVKGQTEEDIKLLHLNNLAICRPGLLMERDNDERFGEKVASWIPFLPKITCRDVAKAYVEHAVASIEKKDLKEFTLLDNSELLDWAKKSQIE
mmetsp:Transcript_25057/g.27787  ORF Transcript_25057/g.27787 Transcript_25057/m.27787 type:complete len:227 (+) Transcript_25057:20-700(+)|eukprot:CAMPEP_0205803968 /NCGR_PEP_ID=MMETSP0205-20121125/6736_1 /ASSEMBLY_ACC=CAM_ASM_000278 /TAXON_ID=36767 /ORGANISM="Euplotes focardii, Strain TN1" /LENGTH=226 /DNA_ID=CAMNT_0053072805 /DNA_START=12 /DNA_END=692 /DNA_ORIENTATION=+